MLEPFIPRNLTARVGETIEIPIMVRRLNAVALQSVVDSCQFVFRYNPTVLIPLRPEAFDATVLANNLMNAPMTVRVGRRLRENDVIVRIPMLVCLGDVDTTELAIDTPQGYPFRIAVDGKEYISIRAVSGILSIANSRWHTLSRAVNANVHELSMNITPNPIQSVARIEVHVGRLPAPPALGVPSIAFYAMSGHDLPLVGIHDINTLLYNSFVGRTSATVTVVIPRAIPRGQYVVRFTYGPYSVSRIVVIE
ncbi:MAG: hypothetical protein RML40_08390 [Bacteroidota bacterium]|nr:hypothetical protein [Candidatus Kapabacteria bacterium]MDW8220534.1 hypothetical protein [Bacteroidota bacterium]